ncbi:universal stress protein [Natrononativus amylolyticus]|uniref:universal stress protein n=1 Tax=Natrononativus amylolyticus TaxID=2963434 RepID=UPI003CE5130E
MVPYDGSPPSKNALEYTFEKFPDVDVTALNVVPVPEGYREVFTDVDERIPAVSEAEGTGRTILDEAMDLSEAHDRELAAETDTGTPEHVTIEHTEDSAHDMIVIGSHGRGGVAVPRVRERSHRPWRFALEDLAQDSQ